MILRDRNTAAVHDDHANPREKENVELLVVTVNGSTERLVPGTTVEQLVARCCTSTRGIAVARNGEVVSKSKWPSTAVEHHDRVEIVTATAGG